MELKCGVLRDGYAFRAIPSASNIGMVPGEQGEQGEQFVPDSALFEGEFGRLHRYLPFGISFPGKVSEKNRKALHEAFMDLWNRAGRPSDKRSDDLVSDFENASSTVVDDYTRRELWVNIFKKLEMRAAERSPSSVPAINWKDAWNEAYQAYSSSSRAPVVLRHIHKSII